MAKYTLGNVTKALVAGGVATIGAAAAAAGGADLSVLDPAQWAIALGAGLTTFGGTFAARNAEGEPNAASAPADVARAAAAVRAMDQDAAEMAQRAIDLKGVLASAVGGVAEDVFDRVLRAAGGER